MDQLHSENPNQAHRAFDNVWNGTTRLVDRTSASAPAFAAIVASANDALAVEKLPSMGFPQLMVVFIRAFTVTEGSIPGCNTTGFPAMKGWDVASG